MSGGLVTAAYIVAAILFIFSLAGLSRHETSKQGNLFGVAGMAIALIATILGPDSGNVGWIIIAMIIGGSIGVYLAKKVEMTEMPELVAVLHSFVGLAAVLVGFNSYLDHGAPMAPVMANIHLTEVFLGIFIGAVTFTGSIVAFGKAARHHLFQTADAAEPPQAESGGAGDLVPAAGGVRAYRQRGLAGGDAADDGDRAGFRLASGGLDRRRRHAGGGVDAQLHSGWAAARASC